MQNSRSRSAWDYPDCPRCDSPVYVGKKHGPGHDYVCHLHRLFFDGNRRVRV